MSDSTTTKDNLNQENNESKNQQEIPKSSVLLNEKELEDRSLFEVDGDFDFLEDKRGILRNIRGEWLMFETAFGEDWLSGFRVGKTL